MPERHRTCPIWPRRREGGAASCAANTLSSLAPSHVGRGRPFLRIERHRFGSSMALHTLHARKIAMRVVAGVVLKPHIVVLVIDEARLPIARVYLRIVDRDDVFELAADLADAL